MLETVRYALLCLLTPQIPLLNSCTGKGWVFYLSNSLVDPVPEFATTSTVAPPTTSLGPIIPSPSSQQSTTSIHSITTPLTISTTTTLTLSELEYYLLKYSSLSATLLVRVITHQQIHDDLIWVSIVFLNHKKCHCLCFVWRNVWLVWLKKLVDL